MLTADPNVWEAYLKRTTVQVKPFKFYYELKDVFTDMGATGEHAATPLLFSASLLVTDTQETEEVDWPPIDIEDPTPSMRKRGRATSSDPIASDDDVPASNARCASKKRKRIRLMPLQSSGKAIARALSELSNTATALAYSNTQRAVEVVREYDDTYSVTKMLRLLRLLEDKTKATYFLTLGQRKLSDKCVDYQLGDEELKADSK